MKKTFLVLITTLTAGVITSNAQVSFGVKGGLNMASVSNVGSSSSSSGNVSSSSGSKMKFGMHLGGYVSVPFSDMFGFQPEVLYSMKGYKYEWSTTIGTSTSKSTSDVTLSYIEIPLQLRINPNENLYFLAGPYFGILAGAKGKSTYQSGSINTESTSSSTDGLTKLDIGMALGLGYQMESGFNIGLKYSRGFNTIFDPDNSSANVNSVFQLFLGFGFGGR